MRKLLVTLSTLAVSLLLACGSGPKEASAAFMPIYTASGGSVSACPQTVGTLTVNVTVTRSGVGRSPLLVFFNATGTTDSATLSGANNTFQDVYYSWNFGDSGSSGTGNWRWGSGSGYSAKNTATGPVAAHLYIVADGAGDTAYTPIVTATDGTNTVSCTVAVTAYDPTGANGWSAANTTCYSTTGTFTSCPAGATHTTVSTFSAVNGDLTGKRLLFRCGETFTGDNEAVSGSAWHIGAFGGCEGTQTNRPIFSDASGSNYAINVANTASDGRIGDIDFEGAAGGSVSLNMNVTSQTVPPTRITLNNIKSNGFSASMSSAQATEFGLIDSDMIGKVGSGGINVFLNYSENNCINHSTAYNCGGSPSFIPIDYNAIIGSQSYSHGGTGGNVESVRISACRYCVISNNYFDNAISAAANFKFHQGNTSGSLNGFIGQYAEYNVISDNNFGFVDGSQWEVAPQNGGVDERIRYALIERNFSAVAPASSGIRIGYLSGQNITFRNNVTKLVTSGSNYAQTSVQTGSRGSCQLTNACGSDAGAGNFLPTGFEVYNNTCYSPTGHGGVNCIQNDTGGSWGAPAQSSFFKNNMLYVGTGSGYTTVTNTGTGNTVSNNTVTATNDPVWTNASTTFSLISDFKPTANYTGGTSVPNYYDALGVAWGGTWDLGAVKH